MRKIRERRIFRLLCKTHKLSNGDVNWGKVANELRKLPSYKDKFKIKDNVCEKCGK